MEAISSAVHNISYSEIKERLGRWAGAMAKPIIGHKHHLVEPMEDASAKAYPPSKKALENYASAYLGAYMNAIEHEKPEHVPSLARNAPYKVEVCLMPNQSFVMLFQRSGSPTVTVTEKAWGYVEGAVMSGVSHMVTVYAHEGPTVADAISKGKKDAVRDIRSLEDSGVSKAVAQLEKVLGELSSIEHDNKDLTSVAEAQLEKLRPIKEAIAEAGPEIDMLAMLDALRNAPWGQAGAGGGGEDRRLLEDMCRELGDLTDIIRRIESQDQKLEELRQGILKSLSEFNRSLDDKVGKGLAVVLSSSDRKIDKAITEMQAQVAMVRSGDTPKELEARLSVIEDSMSDLRDRPDVAKEVVLAVAEMREDVGRLGQRVTRLEQHVTELMKQRAPPQRR
jgi:hypothetical protein